MVVTHKSLRMVSQPHDPEEDGGDLPIIEKDIKYRKGSQVARELSGLHISPPSTERRRKPPKRFGDWIEVMAFGKVAESSERGIKSAKHCEGGVACFFRLGG
ncbi:unnamed protein product [Sphenostylis stenocarpa]|uniref:Uncharacterized protein n=1 Tax=Sphenostylis stenocarpa TaxID=92480 RepID=A0AA86VCA0_9FABA|nr:unnamed protein product [Sphenostylis stenocarpa]